jgi:hypothetical protein
MFIYAAGTGHSKHEVPFETNAPSPQKFIYQKVLK